MLTRREAALGLTLFATPALATAPTVPRWGVHEITLKATAPGNPFDVALTATFTDGKTTLKVRGFHDGDGTWKIRFSPPSEGLWHWRTSSPVKALNGQTGAFTAVVARDHGPLKVVAGFHFAHADGTPYRQVGTTAYAWAQQSDALCDETLATLKASPFNKMRMCVFPNVASEPIFPFEKAGESWDYDRPNPAYFRRLEDRVRRLAEIGVQADLILFHPYDDKTGWHAMTPARDHRYVRYMVARFASFSNVWWSLANEWDLVKAKSVADFERIGQLIKAEDPYGRLCSIHNWRELYDNGRPWITHASIQNGAAVLDDTRAELLRSVWKKPVIYDEVRYEGDIDKRWGDLKPEGMVERFWHGLVAGTYVGHGEIYKGDDGWTAKGGKLHGESTPRLAFLKTVMEVGPKPGFEPIDKWWDQHLGGQAGTYYLRYFGEAAPTAWALALPKDALKGGERFKVDILDTWNMTVTLVEGEFVMAKKDAYYLHDPKRPTVALPGRPWMAVRVIRL